VKPAAILKSDIHFNQFMHALAVTSLAIGYLILLNIYIAVTEYSDDRRMRSMSQADP
jgi:hypothetical protein